MLRSVEIRTVLALTASPSHNLHWRGRLALSLDCFICQRVGRTTIFEEGAERAVCSGDDETGEHYTPGRIAAFDHRQDKREQTGLLAIVDYWWAPFHDAKRDQPAALTRTPWVRHHLGYYCPTLQESGELSIQTNLVRPYRESCRHCSVPLIESREAPQIRLLT